MAVHLSASKVVGWRAPTNTSTQLDTARHSQEGMLADGLLTLMSLSPPPVAMYPSGWKSMEKTGSLLCQMICSVFAFIAVVCGESAAGVWGC